MSNLRIAAQQALEALERGYCTFAHARGESLAAMQWEAITALRAALRAAVSSRRKRRASYCRPKNCDSLCRKGCCET